MAAYLVANFTITNPAGYREYVPAVIKSLEAHGAEVLAADYESEALEGQAGEVTVVIRFATKQALNAWYRSPEYQSIIHLRTDNSAGIVVAANEFDLERNLKILAAL